MADGDVTVAALRRVKNVFQVREAGYGLACHTL
jgi:hypothetical protein